MTPPDHLCVIRSRIFDRHYIYTGYNNNEGRPTPPYYTLTRWRDYTKSAWTQAVRRSVRINKYNNRSYSYLSIGSNLVRISLQIGWVYGGNTRGLSRSAANCRVRANPVVFDIIVNCLDSFAMIQHGGRSFWVRSSAFTWSVTIDFFRPVPLSKNFKQ